MKRIGIILLCLFAATALLTAEGNAEKASGGTWPKGNVQVIVPAKAGGGTDVMARIFTDYLQAGYRQPCCRSQSALRRRYGGIRTGP